MSEERPASTTGTVTAVMDVPEGYQTCNVYADGVQTNHLVRWVGNGTPGPTACGLTRFDSAPGANDADLPGWSMGGGVFGPDVQQLACPECWEAANLACWRCAQRAVVVRQGHQRPFGLCADHLVTDTIGDAIQAVDRAIRPLGYGNGASNSPWNQGYEQAKAEALNALRTLRTYAESTASNDGGPDATS